MRSTFMTTAKVSSIFAAILFLVIRVEGRPRNDENDFRVKQRFEATILGDSPAVWEDGGIHISARPVFVRGATTTGGAVTGFDVAITYQPENGNPEAWMSKEFIGNITGNEYRLGPFDSDKGTKFIVEIHIHSTSKEARLEFRLASDGIIIKDKVPEKKPSGFSLQYARKSIPAVALAKDVYTFYSSVTFVVDLVKLATGAIAPQKFLVDFVIGQITDQIVALIPDGYEGLVGYQCNRCGRQGKLDDFSGCVDLRCPACDNRARICFRSMRLGSDFSQ